MAESELRRMIDELAAIEDPEAGALATHRHIREMQDSTVDAAALLRSFIERLREGGWDDPRIGAHLGISKQRVGKIAPRTPPEEGSR